MASAIIHICVAKEVNKYLNMDEKYLFLGAIAPDISKHLSQTKEISHFLDHTNEDDVPNVDRFLAKYKDELVNPFEMGYFIHLLTDKYWFRDYVYQYVERYTKDETKRKITYTAMRDMIYNDYTTLNIQLIDKYEIPLDIFSNRFELPTSKITEIPVKELNLLIDKMSIIIEESKEEKTFLFDSKDIEVFIANTVKYIIKDIQMLGILDQK
ncbi:MAG: zinc dependent phospholipase C family protein [Bacilli bacterium]|nr:zinc dependent phospholipase C family protein [Bacilli bacterium]